MGMRIISYLFFIVCVFAHTAISHDHSYSTFYKAATEYEKNLKNIFHSLHTTPETAFEEYETSQYIKQYFKDNNITYTENWGKKPNSNQTQGTGIVAQIGTGHPPCVAVRTELDALPISEKSNVSFTSQNDGYMHACGHDAHMTCVMGTAKLLKDVEDTINGTVKFVFQPAEEIGMGAKIMVDEGVLTQYPPIQAMFGYHVNPQKPTNHLSTTPTIISSAAEEFHITVKGKGGHAGLPHLTIDPITAAVAVYRSLYDLYARELYFQSDKAGVISVTIVETTPGPFNAIPDEVYLAGTIRAPYLHTLEKIKNRIQTIAKSVTASYNCDYDLVFHFSAPPVVNSKTMFDFFKQAMKTANITEISHQPLQMTGDDFAYFSEKIPTFFINVGIGGDETTKQALHTPTFKVDEDFLPFVSAMNAYLASEAISQQPFNENS